MRHDYNWREVFKYGASPIGIEGYAGSTAGFDVDDVALVIASRYGHNDDASWLAAVKLLDGRYAYIEAWCDYTGWG